MRTHPTNYRASYKALRSCGPKEFFGTEGAVGLLSWLENIEFVLYISKFPAKRKNKNHWGHNKSRQTWAWAAACVARTARISIPPIEPNLAERARISAINLDDYQFDPLTSHIPPPSSPFTMVLYQRMIAEMDPTQREEASKRKLLHTILEDMDRYPNACLEELEAFMILWDVKPRVEERSLETLSVDELITQLRQMCEDAEDHASNAQEEARQKRKEALEEVVQQIYRTNN
ncbi:hypothetical protein Tco_0516260 [Tanacetum coccineum]